jgi:cytochrome c-type biogenesis protein CcmH/NrfG
MMEASPNDPDTQAAATTELEAAIQVDGDSARVECELGKIALLQSKTDQALAHYQRAYDLNPKDPQAQMGLAGILDMRDNHEQAAAYLRMAIASDPFNATAHYRLAQVDKELHLEEESKKEMNLYLDIRKSTDKVRQLYRQMNPQAPEHDNDIPKTNP